MLPCNPQKLPIAVIYFISPPPKPSFLVIVLKRRATIKKITNPNREPNNENLKLTSVCGNIENKTPITIKGKESISGIILWKRSIKKIIKLTDNNSRYLKNTIEN